MSKNIGAKDLGIDTASQDEQPLFRWFLASYLFGKRISQEIAKNTWEAFMKHGVDTPRKIANRSWQELVDILGEGHYRRYDESTASNLHDMAGYLIEQYSGKITNLIHEASSRRELEQKLQEIKGVGPKTAQIFSREVKV